MQVLEGMIQKAQESAIEKSSLFKQLMHSYLILAVPL